MNEWVNEYDFLCINYKDICPVVTSWNNSTDSMLYIQTGSICFKVKYSIKTYVKFSICDLIVKKKISYIYNYMLKGT